MGLNLFLTRTHRRRDQRRHFKHHFDSVAKKQKRRQTRLQKVKRAEETGLPTGQLRPTVRCCGYRHKLRARQGRGFSAEELKEAKIGMNVVKILSISFDKRRRSCHGENVATLRDFLSKIVVDKRDFFFFFFFFLTYLNFIQSINLNN